MTKKESLALLAQGREAWNAWADGMLAEGRRMEAAGEWAAERLGPLGLVGTNGRTKLWINTASLEFSITCLSESY